MPVKNGFKTCDHVKEGEVAGDWRECYMCLDTLAMQLAIARSYLKELAMGNFNDDGVCQKPIAEPVQGRGFQSIAATGLSASED